MTDEEALLRAITAHPEEDTPRLMFADYLDERGDHERAEFIRVQCGLARLDEDDPELARLKAREKALLDRRRKEWAEPVRRVLGGYQAWDWPAFTTFRRGFVEGLMLEARALLEHGEQLVRDVPTLRSLRLLRASGLARELAACPALAQAHELQVVNDSRAQGFLTPADLRTLFGSPNVRQLRALSLADGQVGDDGSAVLATSPNLAGLRSLNLSGARVGPTGARALASSGPLTQLASLNLWRSHIGHDAASELFCSPNATCLEELALDRCGVSDAGCAALARSPHLTRLRTLLLPENGITADGAEALARSPNLRNLRVLDLASNNFGAAGIRALAHSPHLPELRTLKLRGNRIDESGAAALVESEQLGRLTRLEISSGSLPGSSVHALWVRFRDRVYL